MEHLQHIHHAHNEEITLKTLLPERDKRNSGKTVQPGTLCYCPHAVEIRQASVCPEMQVYDKRSNMQIRRLVGVTGNKTILLSQELVLTAASTASGFSRLSSTKGLINVLPRNAFELKSGVAANIFWNFYKKSQILEL